jgi:hypothetical protein
LIHICHQLWCTRRCVLVTVVGASTAACMARFTTIIPLRSPPPATLQSSPSHCIFWAHPSIRPSIAFQTDAHTQCTPIRTTSLPRPCAYPAGHPKWRRRHRSLRHRNEPTPPLPRRPFTIAPSVISFWSLFSLPNTPTSTDLSLDLDMVSSAHCPQRNCPQVHCPQVQATELWITYHQASRAQKQVTAQLVDVSNVVCLFDLEDVLDLWIPSGPLSPGGRTTPSCV